MTVKSSVGLMWRSFGPTGSPLEPDFLRLGLEGEINDRSFFRVSTMFRLAKIFFAFVGSFAASKEHDCQVCSRMQ